MGYQNLNELIRNSKTSRDYFYHLPVEIQIQLHQLQDSIHTAADLHATVDQVKHYNRQIQLSGFQNGLL